ncbi:MAG: type I methionyl aminopeptidase [Chloroflexota bacterium]
MINVKSRAELAKMRRASRIVADALDACSVAVRPGVTTGELDAIAERVIRDAGASPSFKGYTPDSKRQPPFPGTICASVNEELVHGIPAKRVLVSGDVISIDVGAIWEGYHGDAALTLAVGEISADARRLLDVTQESLYAGIDAARGGSRLGDVSHAIQRVIESGGYSVVQGYGGHGVGRRLHEDPHVSNSGQPGKGPLLQPGMTIALEPMANIGNPETVVRSDQWTVITADRKLCAHYEHTICVTSGVPEVLTEFSPSLYQRIGGPVRGPRMVMAATA